MSVEHAGGEDATPSAQRKQRPRQCRTCRRFGRFAPGRMVCVRCEGALPLVFPVRGGGK